MSSFFWRLSLLNCKTKADILMALTPYFGHDVFHSGCCTESLRNFIKMVICDTGKCSFGPMIKNCNTTQYMLYIHKYSDT